MERVKNQGKNLVGRLGFLLLGVLFLNSCSSRFYQVGYLASEQVPQKEGYFSVKEGDLEFVYDFWGNGGVLFAKLINRTDKPMYVHWDLSNYIINGAAFPYMKMPQVIESSEDFILSGVSLDPGMMRDSSREIRLTRTSNKKGALAGSQVPPQAMIYSQDIPLVMPALGLKNKETRRFDFDSSPMYVRNYVCYSDKPVSDNENLRCVDHGFYVHSVTKMTRRKGKAEQQADRFYIQKYPSASTVGWVSLGAIPVLALLLIVI